ncbi:MAG: hypothetical protein H6R17_404 [Proteobacteria bacterium]|nr:hypothetical protein [Pseudomonadota bacterium]
MNLIRIASALLIVLSLASCATMTPEECRFANWNDVGMRDGLDGKTLALLNTRVSDCAEAGVRVDGNAYLKGRDNGLRSYCRLENAAPLGLNGGSYEGVCPAQIDGEFRRRYQLGYNVYAAHAEVARIDNRMQWLEQRLRQLDRDEDRRLRDANKEDDRRRIRRDIDDERHRIRDELRDLDRAQYRAREAARYAEWTLSQLR